MSASVGKGILIIVENLHVPFDRRVWQEANTLKNAGNDVYIICIKGKKIDTKEYECINGIHIYRHPLFFEARNALGFIIEYITALWHEIRLAWKIYKICQFKIIQACNPPDLIFLVALPFKLFYKVKFIFDHHDLNPELYIAKYKKKDFIYRALLWCERQTFRFADFSIATNQSYYTIAITRGKMPPDKVAIVRSGPSFERLFEVPADSSLKRGKKYLVGYVGTIGQQEGIPYLLRAALYLRDSCIRNDIYFIIVGGGPEQPLMKQLAEELKLTDMVEFTGRISDEQLRIILSTCDMCVNPDEANEMNDKSTMNKIMEYMAMRKAIVQFDLREGRFTADKASLYAQPNDPIDFAQKIAWLLDHEIERKQMGESGYHRIKSALEWKYEEPKYLAIYQQAFSI